MSTGDVSTGDVSTGDVSTGDSAYRQYRQLMFGIAYRMLGSVTDAEDIVQEAFLRYYRAESAGAGEPGGLAGRAGGIGSPKGFLAAVTTRLCIDQLRSARVRRETYPGPWLPEPLLTDESAPDPAGVAELADSLSMAFLLLLERLSPVERAVFLLHDVFGYAYPEVASIVAKSEDNCRQLASRARRHVAEHRTRFEASRRKRDELAGRFLSAVADGNLDGLVTMLAADATVYGDSGGVSPAWPRPITGRDHVSRLLAGLGSQLREAGAAIRRTEVNGQPGALFLAPDDTLISVLVLDIADGQVQAIRSVISRPKLRHLGPLADLSARRGQRRPAG